MGFGVNSGLYTAVVKSDGKSYNYLIDENNDNVLDIYLSSMQGSRAAYKAEVTPDMLSTMAQRCERSSLWMRNLLFAQETGVLWFIETDQSSAKITWKKSLASGMKLTLGSVSLTEHPSAPSDMLSICSAALQKETSRTSTARGKCERLEKENAKLLQLASDAVQARQLLEDDLVGKFARLLNEKKAKIRALQELLAERRADDLSGAGGSGSTRDATGATTPDRPPPEDPDQPDSDAYDQETDVDTDCEGEEAAAEPGPSNSGAQPPVNDSLELDCDALDDPLPVRPKRPAPEMQRAPPPEKRRLADSDDLLDIV